MADTLASTTKGTSIGIRKLRGKSVTINSVTMTVLDRDDSSTGYVMRATGTTVPTDGSAGFAVGATFIKTNGSYGTTTYINEGSTSSSDFNALIPSGTDGATQYAEVTVSTAEILALNATPKTLVAAPGAGKVLEFVSAVAILDYNSAAYAGIGATEDLAIRYTDGSGAIVSTTLEATGFLDQTADQLRTHKAITTDLTPVANAALVLHMLNGEVTTGNSPMRYKVAYRVHSTGL